MTEAAGAVAKKKRTTITREQQDDLLRRYRLSLAFGASEPVVIDGVSIDLSCELDSKLWRPIAPLGTYGHQGIRYGPRIVFPWTPSEWAEKWRGEGEVVEAPAGSRIKIAMIHTAPLRATFKELDLAENRERKLAYIWVFQPNGELKLAEPPLQLIAETATDIQIELESYRAAYGSLVSKLERLIGCEDLEDLLDGPLEQWPKLPDDLSVTYRRAVLALREAISEGDESAYAAFGYLMARAEAEQQLLEPALREHAAARHRAEGGQARRSNSRRRTEPLRDLAKGLILGNPTLSLGACAKGVSAIVADDADWSMSNDPDWIADQIRELFNQREVPGRIEYQPKPEWVRPT
jgi:hypothetical protein